MRESRWIPWAIGGFFSVFLLAALALAVIAARSDPGLVAGAPQRMAGTYILSTAPAPVLELRLVTRSGTELLIEARIRGADGRSATAEAVTGVLQRATHARSDLALPFAPTSDGAWRAVVLLPSPGIWEVAARATSAGSVAAATLRL